jgi:hypothetical protein
MLDRARLVVVRWTARLVRWVTTALLYAGLTVAYFVGILAARVLASIAARGLLPARRRVELPSYWQDAKGYGTTEADLLDPS